MNRPTKPSNYDAFLADVVGLLENARRAAARSVNSVLTLTYFEIGQRIFEHEQRGEARAEYGELLLNRLSADLSKRFGRGFSRSNVFQMRQFYLAYQEKIQTVSGKSRGPAIIQTASGQFDVGPFALSWSHYARLLSVADASARQFYEEEALRGGWWATSSTTIRTWSST
ncbi:MAG: DUF1016 domain-containing protein [Acidobacteria bacterium]|nr:DUF1016 domain-containing protein [Acidobacteriota bacterium]